MKPLSHALVNWLANREERAENIFCWGAVVWGIISFIISCIVLESVAPDPPLGIVGFSYIVIAALMTIVIWFVPLGVFTLLTEKPYDCCHLAEKCALLQNDKCDAMVPTGHDPQACFKRAKSVKPVHRYWYNEIKRRRADRP